MDSFYVSESGSGIYHVAEGTAETMHAGGTLKALCGVPVQVDGYAIADGKCEVSPICKFCASRLVVPIPVDEWGVPTRPFESVD